MLNRTLTQSMFTQYTLLIDFLNENDPEKQRNMIGRLQKAYWLRRESGDDFTEGAVEISLICAALGNTSHLSLALSITTGRRVKDAFTYAIANYNTDNINYCNARYGRTNSSMNYLIKYAAAYGPLELFDDLYESGQVKCIPDVVKKLAILALAHGQWTIFKKLETSDMDFRTEMKDMNEDFNDKELLPSILDRSNFPALQYLMDNYYNIEEDQKIGEHILCYALRESSEDFVHHILSMPIFKKIIKDNPACVTVHVGRMPISVFQRVLDMHPEVKASLFTATDFYQSPDRLSNAWLSILTMGHKEAAVLLLAELTADNNLRNLFYFNNHFNGTDEKIPILYIVLNSSTHIHHKRHELLEFVMGFEEVRQDFEANYNNHFKQAFGAKYQDPEIQYLAMAAAFLKQSKCHQHNLEVHKILVWFIQSIFEQLQDTKQRFEEIHKTPYKLPFEQYLNYYDLLIHAKRFAKLNVKTEMEVLSDIYKTNMPIISIKKALGFTLHPPKRSTEQEGKTSFSPLKQSHGMI